jgi:hypothetical protein
MAQVALQNDNRREKLRLLEGLAIGRKEIGGQEKAASAPAVRMHRASAVLAVSGVVVLSVGGAYVVEARVHELGDGATRALAGVAIAHDGRSPVRWQFVQARLKLGKRDQNRSWNTG